MPWLFRDIQKPATLQPLLWWDGTPRPHAQTLPRTITKVLWSILLRTQIWAWLRTWYKTSQVEPTRRSEDVIAVSQTKAGVWRHCQTLPRWNSIEKDNWVGYRVDTFRTGEGMKLWNYLATDRVAMVFPINVLRRALQSGTGRVGQPIKIVLIYKNLTSVITFGNSCTVILTAPLTALQSVLQR